MKEFSERLIIEDFDVSGQYGDACDVIVNALKSFRLHDTPPANDRGQRLLVYVLCSTINFINGINLDAQDYVLHHLDKDDTNNDVTNLALIGDIDHKALHHDSILHAMYTYIRRHKEFLAVEKGKHRGAIPIKPNIFSSMNKGQEYDLVNIYIDVLSKKNERDSKIIKVADWL